MALADWLGRWVARVARHATGTVVVLAAITAALGFVAVDRFRINSNLSDLILQQADWRDDFDTFMDRFPDRVDTLVVVVSSRSLKRVEDAAQLIQATLQAQPEWFSAVSAPMNEPFLRDHALLFQSEANLHGMVDRLAQAQPVLTAIAQDPSLRSVFDLLGDGVAQDPVAGFDRIVELVTRSGERALSGEDAEVLWTDEFFEVEGEQFRLISVKGARDFGETLPNAAVVERARETISELALPSEVRVGLTGEVALAHEEIRAAVSGVQIAGWAALGLLALVMIVGVRSIKIIAATFVMLLVGVVWTSALAMLTVGEYNTLSLVFIVLFFGLGVDFSIHYSLRYQEAVNAGSPIERALVEATGSVGNAIAICTLTTALGFLCFWPTDYKGLADLGVISAIGMFVAGALTFTLLPALYVWWGPLRPHVVDLPTGDRLVHWLVTHRPRVIVVLTICTVGAVFVASRAHFDYSVLALKDEAAESMRTLRRLQAEGVATDYSLFLVGDDVGDLETLETLDVVDSVSVPQDLVPAEQAIKLAVLQDLQQLLWSALEPWSVRDPPTDEALRAAASELRTVLEQEDAHPRLRAVLKAMPAEPETLARWQAGVIGNLVDELAWLRRAVHVGEIRFEDLPASVRGSVVSADGSRLAVVTPAEDIAPVAALSRFIESVRAVAPSATGRPVLEWGVGGIVIGAFQQAFASAIVAIFLILLAVFRRFADAALILFPLVLASVFTLAAGVLLVQPLNMANVLVLPLIFGLGVDNGIHVLDRFRRAGDVDHLLHSSTPRAVILSTLTTMGAFSALMLSPHAGTASIGLLLAVAVGLLLAFTVFLLPVLLTSRS